MLVFRFQVLDEQDNDYIMMTIPSSDITTRSYPTAVIDNVTEKTSGGAKEWEEETNSHISLFLD